MIKISNKNKKENNKKDDNFIMLPNNLVWDSNDKNNTLIKTYGNNLVHVLPYLDVHTNRLGKTIFSLSDIITTCGLTPKFGKSGKGKSTEQFRNILLQLKENNIIQTEQDLQKVKLKDLVRCEFQMPIKKNKDGENTQFFRLYHDTYLEIMDRYNEKLNKLTLLHVYMYICSRISRRPKETYIDDDGKERAFMDDMGIHGGKSNCFYDEYINICGDLDLSQDTFNTYIQELNKMGLVFYGNIGQVKSGKNTKIACNTYCLEEKELPEALEQSKLHYEGEGYEIIGQKTNSDMRKINGKKGKIKQMQNQGKNTSKLERELAELESKKAKKKKKAKDVKPKEKVDTPSLDTDIDFDIEDFFNDSKMWEEAI